MHVEMSDGIIPFIKEKMSEVDPTIYNETDYPIVFDSPHKIVADIDINGKIIAFCVIMVLEECNKMCYSWSDGTKLGKRAYLLGIRYMVANYGPIGFAEVSTEIHEVQRILGWR